MSLPKELVEPIDEIKTPSNKILIIVLILSCISLTSVVAYVSRQQLSDKNKQITELKIANERMNKYISDRNEADNKILKEKILYYDSIINITNSLINKKSK